MEKEKDNVKNSSSGKKILIGIVLVVVWCILVNFAWNLISPSGIFDFLIFSFILGIITILSKSAYAYITNK